MKVFLDDERQPQQCIHYMHLRIGKDNPIYLEDWVIVRNFDQFLLLIETYFEKNIKITHISFDHDLADLHYDPATGKESFSYHEKTGYDCAKFMKEFYEEKKLDLPILYVHSMNPVGAENIINLFK